MRRALLVLVALLALTSCATQERPEGIVERWLLALNQGSAGEPGRYAPDRLSQEILPDWRTVDLGELDTIEVGRGADRCEVFIACETRVPLRVVRLDGTELRLDAIVPSRTASPGGVRRVQALVQPDPLLHVPSEGARGIGAASVPEWATALGIGVALLLVGEGVMRLARSRTTD